MNFRGNTFSLGGGEFVSARAINGGQCELFIRNSGITARRSFWQWTRNLQTSERNASFSDACWLVDNGMIELRDNRLFFETRKN
ncbi:MAG: hypothetical protein FWE03_01480 [Firmicutes bacterium]|nr:hypothetical protein [Bacillota bacterium]